MDNNKIYDAAYKKAIGFETEETVEEYTADQGEIRLSKRRVTKKFVPPDIAAIKLLSGGGAETDIKKMTLEELEYEKIRLIKLLEDNQ